MLLWQPLWVLMIMSGNMNVKKNFQHYKVVVIHLGQIAATICGLFHTYFHTYLTQFTPPFWPQAFPGTAPARGQSNCKTSLIHGCFKPPSEQVAWDES